jgi:dienelactone hydrolase
MFERIEYEVAGRAFHGDALAPAETDGRRCPAVLILHGGGGPTDHERARVRAFAARGYVACAPDLFGETFADRARGLAVIGALLANPVELRARCVAALDALAGRRDVDPDRIAAVGHCFGGMAALELARSGAALRAAVSLHGRLVTALPAERGRIRARVLACTGADDPFCPRDQRIAFEDEMTGADADWQLHIYSGAKHGFSVPDIDATNLPGCAYDARADRRSHAATLACLDEAFAG